MNIACPLCTSHHIEHYYRDKKRTYQRCLQCNLIFVPDEYHLAQAQEKQVYDFHENSLQDAGYRKFLDKLLAPLSQRLAPHARGLDFGCGPGPTIKPMMEEQGFSVNNYDIYYANNPAALSRHYDFITCTEAIEHFSRPGKELSRLDSLLESGGFLGIMTKRATTKDAFSQWHYKNDPTHICFFSEATFRWLADWLNYDVDFPGNDTVILQKR
ncbi:class I SAM-dependent methyltransferase [Kangiella shandongensis]|uniref:class I SAM-dependent methyltransferase n=1 Tax=Kangiella shandongensis TaxID=2763258 RepID=UPI001CBC190D|nr:class I SAM-dependent methyltransferase [Kangiella shandongensis]